MKHKAIISYLIPVALGALIGYPLFFALSLLFDALIGSGQFIAQLLLESKREIARQFIDGWKNSLPVFSAITALIAAPAIFFTGRGKKSAGMLAFLAGAALAGAIAAWIGLTAAQSALVATALLATGVLAILASWVLAHGRLQR